MENLEQRKVLVVIDDTDDQRQLKDLLPPCQLHPDSLVIVTSRNSVVLYARCTQVSEVQVLPEGCDMQLFKAWAFAAGEPVWDTSLLVPRLVACCGRLPLTLKVGIAHAPNLQRTLHLKRKATACPQVMGSHLKSKRGQRHEQEMWREALDMLQKASELPAGEERLFVSLRISYDALNDDQKRMFLDAAFFFLGRRADTAKHVWKGCACT